ncbi:MAG: transposase, partial [Rhodoferax sp.]|nr:transposase [Rhodoferax sp.]
MARRRFEMFQYRQALVRMRLGDSDRQIAAARIMGRRTAARLRELGTEHHWLDVSGPMPADEAIAAALGQPKRASTTVSSLAAQRERIQGWAGQGVSGVAIFAALQREQGWSGSYSSVRRILADIRSSEPPQTSCRLDFAPGEAVQVDFGAGPMLMHPDDKLRRTWAFVMTLCFSRHQYVEFVWDQSAATWLGCHRRAFEWFAAMPQRVII